MTAYEHKEGMMKSYTEYLVFNTAKPRVLAKAIGE